MTQHMRRRPNLARSVALTYARAKMLAALDDLARDPVVGYCRSDCPHKGTGASERRRSQATADTSVPSGWRCATCGAALDEFPF